MPLPPKTVLGPYEILAPIGAGGMGEVYRAIDSRLGRIVAIKVLPQHLSSNTDVRQRFEREARAVSSLNHQHICTLHDIGHQDGIDYLVMEYIEGETLATRLQKGPLTTADVLQYSIQIMSALDKAHKKGIVHRDLKPGNIMLTKSGIKLLDFGLAKLQTAMSEAPEASSFPTEHQDLTKEGMILGTVQYMAPEQLEGKNSDARTDIFAFGSILYEMATGKKAFAGGSRASLITAIMSSEPPLISTIQPMTPPALDRVVKICLAKDPEERWQNAHDLMNELKWISELSSQMGVAQAVINRRKSRNWIPWIITAFALLSSAATLILYRTKPTTFSRTISSSIVLPEKTALFSAVMSPDGSKFVFIARDSSGRNLLWIRNLNSSTIQPLPGTENPSFPFWSPNSRFIGFFAAGKLKKIDANGGTVQTLCDAPFNRGGTWNQEDVILFSPVVDGPLYRVSASGGRATPLTSFDPARGETTHRWPFFLPDGKHFLYLVGSFGGEREKTGIYVRSLETKEEKFLVRANSNMAYADPGYLFFYHERNLLAQPFDVKNLQIKGEPVIVAKDIQYFPQVFGGLFSVSQNGTLLYQPHAGSGVSQLYWFDRNGKQIGTLGSAHNQANPRISPDGKKVALNIADPETGNMDIWIYQSTGGIPSRFTSDPSFESGPVWSPDGIRLVFGSIRSGGTELRQKNSTGAESETTVTKTRTRYPTDWSQDGRSLLHLAFDPNSNLELWTLKPEENWRETLFMKAPFGVNQGQFSPDGRWVAYTSNESGKWEVHVAPFPGPGGNWQISTTGGSEPRWRRDGKELFYMSADGKIMAVDVKDSSTFDAVAAKALFQTHHREPISSTDLFSYDVSADGQHFLVNTDVAGSNSVTLNLILNWASDLPK